MDSNFTRFLDALFTLLVVVDLVLILARHVIGNPATNNRRAFLFYVSFALTLLVAFIRGVIAFELPEHQIWNLVVELCGGGVLILAYFIYTGYPELWLQAPAQPVKAAKGGRLKKAKA